VVAVGGAQAAGRHERRGAACGAGYMTASLAQVQVARDAAARIQQDLDLKQLPARLLAGRAEPKMLTGEGVMRHAHRRFLAATSTTTMPSVASAAVAGSTPAR
jgi:hypothetical protein